MSRRHCGFPGNVGGWPKFAGDLGIRQHALAVGPSEHRPVGWGRGKRRDRSERAKHEEKSNSGKLDPWLCIENDRAVLSLVAIVHVHEYDGWRLGATNTAKMS